MQWWTNQEPGIDLPPSPLFSHLLPDPMAEEEASPLLPISLDEEASLKKAAAAAPESASSKCCSAGEWTAEGLPVRHGCVVGLPSERSQWNSSIFACLGRNDEFCGSDLEVCFLGSFVPCILHGSNAERLGGGPGTFANNCLPYTGLYMLGNSFFGSNCLAPCFSYPTRTAIRHEFNLEGSCEAFTRLCGCCGRVIEDDAKREQLEAACDLMVHFFCHPCALCQEGRELRRRLPHPGLVGRPVLVMPPAEQMMARGA